MDNAFGATLRYKTSHYTGYNSCFYASISTNIINPKVTYHFDHLLKLFNANNLAF